jgi:hypothetical protein
VNRLAAARNRPAAGPTDPMDLNGGQVDRFTLATLSFVFLEPGASFLDLSIDSLGDGEGNFLAATVSGTTVTAVPLTPSLWLFLGGAGVLLRRGKGSGRRAWPTEPIHPGSLNSLHGSPPNLTASFCMARTTDQPAFQ